MSGRSFQGGSLLMTSNWYWNWRLQWWMGRFDVFVRRRICYRWKTQCHRWKTDYVMDEKQCHIRKTDNVTDEKQCHIWKTDNVGWKTDNVTYEKQTMSRMTNRQCHGWKTDNVTDEKKSNNWPHGTSTSVHYRKCNSTTCASFVPKCNKMQHKIPVLWIWLWPKRRN